MNKKNNLSKRTFVPQAISQALRKINIGFTSKFGKIEFIIHSKWPEIVGSYFTEYSEPKNITKLPDYENEVGEMIYKNHLNVSVAPAAAIEFQHFKDKIIEKINSYFGYKAIIDLRIQQNYITTNKSESKIIKNKLTESEKINIAKEVKNLTNKELKKSLIDLGKNIAKETK